MAHTQLEMSQELNADLGDDDNWPLLSKPKQSKYEKLQARVWQALEERVSSVLDITVRSFFFIVIILSIIIFMLETETELMNDPQKRDVIETIDVIVLSIFTVEYALRLWSCVAYEKFGTLGPILGRLRFVVTLLSIVDLVALIPSWVNYTLTKTQANVYDYFLMLRILRLVRLLRVARYLTAVDILFTTIWNKRYELLTTTVLTSLLVLLVGSVMHSLEGKDLPDHFGSVTKSLWWAVMTLSTLGAQEPQTVAGKIMAGVTAFLAISVFGLQAGVLGSGFVEELQKTRQKGTELFRRRRANNRETTQQMSQRIERSPNSRKSPENDDVLVVKVCEGDFDQFEEAYVYKRTVRALMLAIAENYGRSTDEIVCIRKLSNNTVIKKDKHVEFLQHNEELQVAWR